MYHLKFNSFLGIKYNIIALFAREDWGVFTLVFLFKWKLMAFFTSVPYIWMPNHEECPHPHDIMLFRQILSITLLLVVKEIDCSLEKLHNTWLPSLSAFENFTRFETTNWWTSGGAGFLVWKLNIGKMLVGWNCFELYYYVLTYSGVQLRCNTYYISTV